MTGERLLEVDRVALDRELVLLVRERDTAEGLDERRTAELVATFDRVDVPGRITTGLDRVAREEGIERVGATVRDDDGDR